MVRKIVQEQTVHDLCERLSNAGQTPSTTQVYQELGQGSYTTIQKYIRSWIELRANRTRPKELDLDIPDALKKELNEFIITLWNQARISEGEKLADAREEMCLQRKSFEDEMTKVLARADDTIEKADLLADELILSNSKVEAEQELRRQVEKELALQTAALARAESELIRKMLEHNEQVEKLSSKYEAKLQAITDKYEAKVAQSATIASELAQLTKAARENEEVLSEKSLELDSIRLKQADTERLLQTEAINNNHLNQRFLKLQQEYERLQEMLLQSDALARAEAQSNASLTGKLQEREIQIDRLEEAIEAARGLVSEMGAKILSLQAAADQSKGNKDAQNPIKT